MRVPDFFTAAFFGAVAARAQDNIPLPGTDDRPPSREERTAIPSPIEPPKLNPPRATDSLDLPDDTVPAPLIDEGEPVPKVRLTPKRSMEETSVLNGQFHVWGGTKTQRGRVLDAARRLSEAVTLALRQTQPFRHPIVIQIRDALALPPGSLPVWTDIGQLQSGGFRIEVNLTPLRGGVPAWLFRQEIVRSVLAEVILRDHAETDLAGRDIPPPDWLLYGTLELLDYQARGRPSDAFSTVFNLGRVLGLDDIFQADPRRMDSVSLTIYRVSCCGLVLLMLEQEKGHEQFATLLNQLAAAGDQSTAIARCFPGLTGPGNTMSKWWTLQIASMAQPGMDEILTPSETERLLAGALTLRFPATPPASTASKPAKGIGRLFSKKKQQPATTAKTGTDQKQPAVGATGELTCGIEEFVSLMDRPDRAAIFANAGLSLTKLSLRAHPLYRSMIREYQTVVRDLGAGKKQKESAAIVKRLATVRGRLHADLSAVEDYMDWYEATQADGPGGAFDAYLEAAAALEKPPPPHRDPVTLYLDAVEREFSE